MPRFVRAKTWFFGIILCKCYCSSNTWNTLTTEQQGSGCMCTDTFRGKRKEKKAYEKRSERDIL